MTLANTLGWEYVLNNIKSDLTVKTTEATRAQLSGKISSFFHILGCISIAREDLCKTIKMSPVTRMQNTFCVSQGYLSHKKVKGR